MTKRDKYDGALGTALESLPGIKKAEIGAWRFGPETEWHIDKITLTMEDDSIVELESTNEMYVAITRTWDRIV